jgi:hypothetical protein
MTKKIIIFGLLGCIQATVLGQTQQSQDLDLIFHVNKTPIWSYGFLRNTTREFLENAKGLEQNLIGFDDRLRNQEEKGLILQQAIEMAEWNKDIADLGVKYAEQSKRIAEKNADIANLRARNKEEQIAEGKGTLDFIKKKNKEIVDRNMWASVASSVGLGLVAVAAVIAAPVAVPAAAAAGATTKVMFAAGAAGANSALGALGGGITGTLNESDKNAMQERQIQDQINQMSREKAELDKISQVSLDQITQEQNALATAFANAGKAQEEIKQAKERYDLFSDPTKELNLTDLNDLIENIKQLRSTYIQYSIVLAKLTEKAYQAEEVTTVKVIKDDYTSGETGEWLAADKILLDLNTIEFNRITQKKQKPNFASFTVSLNNKDPWQLELLRQRGVMSFEITQFEIDLGFPGTYAQTIKDIDVTVLALTDPSGVKGQLTKEGLSWKKVPEAIVRDNPYAIDDWQKYVPSGYRAMVFDDENETMILPKLKGVNQEPGLKGIFEGRPVCGTYTLELPKYANNFDFGTIVDVVITINFASYYDETLKSMVEMEVCEMNRAEEFVNKRVMTVSMAGMQPDEWYEFHNPIEVDTLAHKRRYLPFFLRRNYFPSNQLNPALNELSVAFLRNGRYQDLKFSATSVSMNPGKNIKVTNGQINPLQLDTLQLDWFDQFSPLTNQSNSGGSLLNDTVFIHIADSLLLSQKNTNMPDSRDEPYELWILKIEADSIPSLCLEGTSGVFDEDKLSEIDDVNMYFGYKFSNDFCITASRVFAYMDVTDDTTKVKAMDGSMQNVPYFYVLEAGAYRKKTQTSLSWYGWNVADNSFYLQNIIRKGEYADLFPFHTLLKAKTFIEEIDVKLDIAGVNNEMTLYCSPNWIKMKLKRLPNNRLQLTFNADLNQRDRFRKDSIWVINANHTFDGQPARLIFRYLNLADNSGRSTVDITIANTDSQGNVQYSKLFNKAPVFYRWRNDFETNFALRIDRDDDPKPVFILRDIKFSDFSRF